MRISLDGTFDSEDSCGELVCKRAALVRLDDSRVDPAINTDAVLPETSPHSGGGAEYVFVDENDRRSTRQQYLATIAKQFVVAAAADVGVSAVAGLFATGLRRRRHNW